jgi:hypothetical protein
MSLKERLGAKLSPSGNATVAEARAVFVACSPACHAAAVLRSFVAKNPHEPPTRARIPTPARSLRLRFSIWPSRASIDSSRAA